jgi:hypothetical protein
MYYNPQCFNTALDSSPSQLPGSPNSQIDVTAQPLTDTPQETMGICTLRTGPSGRQCGANLPAERHTLAAHLKTVHYVSQVKVPRSRVAGHPLLPCPDESCRCRFRTKVCSMQPNTGARHRTHVVDLVRHCMDKHLLVSKHFRCGTCDQTFSRRESITRHSKNGCPNVSSFVLAPSYAKVLS